MKPLAPLTLQLLAQVYEHQPVSAAELKDILPREHDINDKLYRCVWNGFLRKTNGQYIVTDKGRRHLADHTAAHQTSVAGPRRFMGSRDYTGERASPLRPGSEDHLAVPSLISGRRVYRKDSGRA